MITKSTNRNTRSTNAIWFLHNLYRNTVNLHFEAHEVINLLPLDWVIEIHIERI